MRRTYILNDEDLNLDIRLKKEGGSCDIRIAAIVTKKSDIRIKVYHEADNTTSRVFVKILAKGGVSNFEGLIHAPKGLKNIDAEEIMKALIATEGAVVKAKPDLRIFTEDAKAAHGTAIGAYDEKALFYLKTRGFAENAAKACLSDAFLKEITDVQE